MPHRWNKHAFRWADTILFKYGMNSTWKKNWCSRIEWRRAEKWCNEHSKRWGDIGTRFYPGGYGTRFYWRD